MRSAPRPSIAAAKAARTGACTRSSNASATTKPPIGAVAPGTPTSATRRSVERSRVSQPIAACPSETAVADPLEDPPGTAPGTAGRHSRADPLPLDRRAPARHRIRATTAA